MPIDPVKILFFQFKAIFSSPKNDGDCRFLERYIIKKIIKIIT